jgi:hypothetical protein
MPRLEVAVIARDGSAKIVNASRPATLVAFGDEHEGKQMPESIREIAWVVHHALGVEQPLDEWLASLEDVSAMPDDLALARRIIAGDEDAKRYALGELEALPPATDPTPPAPAPATNNDEPAHALVTSTRGEDSLHE